MARSEACERAYRAYFNRDWATCDREARAALNENPEDADAMNALGIVVASQGDHGLATVLLRHAIALKPDLQTAWSNLGIAHKKAFRYADAQFAWGKALELDPNDAATMANMATIFSNNGTPEMAEKWCRASLRANPGVVEATRNLAFALLEQEKWEEGWQCFEARSVFQGVPKIKNYWERGQTPAWDGTPGKRVVLYGEQGVGDELLFMSMLPDALQVLDNPILDVHPRLVDVVKRSFPGLTVHGTRKDNVVDWAKGEQIDAACALGSLGRFYRNRNEDFPRTPYMVPDREEVIRHRRGQGNKLRVGISWAGGTPETYRDLRSIELVKFLPILRQDADFYSFQYDPDSAKQCAELEEKTGVRLKHFPGLVECKNYDTTMNFAASMDLLITVSGTLFHVGGSMGIPTWCLVPHRPAWRYGRTGETSRWYGSARMYRKQDEDWTPLIERVASDIRSHGSLACAAE